MVSESYFYYLFETGEDCFADVDDVLKLGKHLQNARDLMKGEHAGLKGDFGVYLTDAHRFEFVVAGNPSVEFYNSLFEKAGYPFIADVSRDVGGRLSKLLGQNNVSFKKSGILRKRFYFFR